MLKSNQKNLSKEFEQPKSSARLRCISSNHTNNKSQKSIKKQQYLKTFSPKKGKKIDKIYDNKSSDTQNQFKKTEFQTQCFSSYQKDCLSSQRALRTLEINSNINRQLPQKTSQHHLKTLKPTKNTNQLKCVFEQNEQKILSMRKQLENIFETFKKRERELQQKKEIIKNQDQIKAENLFLSKQVARVQQMIKKVLLEREKLKHAPLSKKMKK